MAASDLDMVRIYADPTLTAREKIARLRGDPMQPIPSLPPDLAALPPEAMAGDTPQGRVAGAAAARLIQQGEDPNVARYIAAGAAPEQARKRAEADAQARADAAAAPQAQGRVAVTEAARRMAQGTPQAQAVSEANRQVTPERIGRTVTAAEQPEIPDSTAGGSETVQASLEGEEGDAVDGGSFREFTRRSLLHGQGGAAPVPTERVRVEEQMQGGAVPPSLFNEIAALAELRDWHTMQGEVLNAGLEQDAANIRINAGANAQLERAELAEIKRRTDQTVAAVRQRQNEISEQIAATDPKEPSLWAGKNFGEKLLTLLSVGLVAVGAGASQDPKMGAEKIKAMANREVERQARFLAMKRGQADELGTIIERHLANYGDVEIAKHAAVADILGRAEFQVQQMINDPRNAQMRSHALMAQQAALGAARKETEGKLHEALGVRVSRATAREFLQERAKTAPVATAVGVQPQTAKPNAETTALTPEQEQQFQAWASENGIRDVNNPKAFYDYRGFWLENGDTPVRGGVDHFPDKFKQHGHPTFSVESQYSKGPADGGRWEGEKFVPAKPPMSAQDKQISEGLDQVEAETAAFAAGKPAPPKPKPTAAAPAARQPLPKAPPAGAAPGPAKPAKAEERFALARKAFAVGRYDVVEQALTAKDWQNINVITKRYKQAGATGGTGGSASEEEARAYAIADYLGAPVPAAYVPASARERMVKLPGGVNVFASSPAHAEKLKAFVPNVQSVLASLNKLAGMADMGGRGWTPEMKADAENTAKATMFYLSTAMDQGVVREGELPIWDKLAGGNMADYVQDPRRDAKAGIKATIAVLRRKLNAELAGVTQDPFGERQYKPAWAQ